MCVAYFSSMSVTAGLYSYLLSKAQLALLYLYYQSEVLYRLPSAKCSTAGNGELPTQEMQRINNMCEL